MQEPIHDTKVGRTDATAPGAQIVATTRIESGKASGGARLPPITTEGNT